MRSADACVAAALSLHMAQAAACWDDAARRYGVPAQLLYAIARVESNLNPRAVNLDHRSRTGSYDIGLMQINSSHLPRLRGFGIGESDLYDPCINIHVGAWILADGFARHGVTWDAVGAYNAACRQVSAERCSELRSRYAWLVYRKLSAPTDEPRVGYTGRSVRPAAAPSSTDAPITAARIAR